MSKIIDRRGKRFGKLTVIKQNIGAKKTSWECLCDCGNTTVVVGGNLTSRNTISCGCVRLSNYKNGTNNRKHGMVHTVEFFTWSRIKQRCYNTSNLKYPSYGERGIKVCDRWLESFNNFFEDMGYRPSDCNSIDRIDNDGDYCPENCKWSTPKEQANNRRLRKSISYNGITMSYAWWSLSLGGTRHLVSHRIKRGWSEERAVSTKARDCHKVKH